MILGGVQRGGMFFSCAGRGIFTWPAVFRTDIWGYFGSDHHRNMFPSTLL